MNIYIPGKRDANTFFDEITNFSKYNFIYKDWDKIEPSKKDVVLFQWPELVFNWEDPSLKKLQKFEKTVEKWKKNTKILYLVHNERRHFGMTPTFQYLYQIVEKSADIMIHFATYSKQVFTQKYPRKKHIVIPHPLYRNSFSFLSKSEARLKLNIPSDRFVMVVPGRIRNLKERAVLLNAFHYLPFKKKSLIVPYMLRKPVNIEFKGRYLLKKIFDIKKYKDRRINESRPPRYYYGFDFQNPELLSLYMSASDVVFIPRLNTLNSGNVYLAFTFRKLVCGPQTGNIKEVLENLNLPAFLPKNKKSLRKAMKELSKKKKDEQVYDLNKLQKYEPMEVAIKWDNMLEQMCSFKK